MAQQTLAISADTLKSGDVPGLSEAFNVAVAALLENDFLGVRVLARDQQRRLNKVLDILVSYEETGTGTLVSPYLLTTFIGTTLEDVREQAQAVIDANPTFFFAPLRFQYIVPVSAAAKPYIGFLFYTEDGTNGPSNWLAG